MPEMIAIYLFYLSDFSTDTSNSNLVNVVPSLYIQTTYTLQQPDDISQNASFIYMQQAYLLRNFQQSFGKLKWK